MSVANARGVITSKDVIHLGVRTRFLAELADKGTLQRVGRGVYRSPQSLFSGNQGLVEVAARCPKCVVCLLSALAFHGIGTQLPPAVWIAIPTHGRAPALGSVQVEIVRMSPRLLAEGVAEHLLEGVPVRITSAVKTVVDCFRYRSRVGTDAVIEALRDGLRRRHFTSDELYRMAEIEHMWRVIEPYAEAIS